MDDLSGLDWNAKYNSTTQARPSQHSLTSPSAIPAHAFAHLTAQPLSRPPSSQRTTPALLGAAKSPVNDSFSTLLSLNPGKPKTDLSLQERQKQLINERRRQIDEQQKRHQHEGQFLESLASGRATPLAVSPAVDQSESSDKSVERLLAGFDASVKVDKSSNFPPPSSSPRVPNDTSALNDDDDPFGLGTSSQNTKTARPPSANYDDILGALGKPVENGQNKPSNNDSAPSRMSNGDNNLNHNTLDKGMAEIVDMGFSAERAREALLATDNDTQAAVGWLLNKAHENSKSKSRGKSSDGRRRPSTSGRSPSRRASSRGRGSIDGVPTWMRTQSQSGQSRKETSSSASKDKDVAQFATELGSALFKSANTFLKAGQKKVQKAVAEYQLEGDSSQPKWMRDVSADANGVDSPRKNSRGRQVLPDESAVVTNEALLLDSTNGRPEPIKSASSSSEMRAPTRLPERPIKSESTSSRERTMPTLRSKSPRAQRQSPARLSRFDHEAETANAYVSSARRKRPPPATAPAEIDPFASKSTVTAPPTRSSTSKQAAVPIPTKQSPTLAQPKRKIPDVAPQDLERSNQHRKAGTEAYKRGDYASAFDSYTAALSCLPSTHPIAIILLCNRAQTGLKTGDVKTALADADQVLSLIGPSKGAHETIRFDPTEPPRPMKDSYAKALTRRAEALEHTEQWAQAALAWRICAATTNSPSSIQARDRCERAAGTVARPRAPSKRPNNPVSSTSDASAAAAGQAVSALRAATAATTRLEDEKFALADVVDARLSGWKAGKADNLRALLASLDSVLWADAGWHKVGMAELVVVGRVKIVYIKAIAKVHPDKIPVSATTEQRMISSSVFATLNEAWDKFKRDNGL